MPTKTAKKPAQAAKPVEKQAAEIIAELKKQGNESYKKIMMNHGAIEPIFGVKIEYLKKIQKRVKQDYDLAKALFDSGVYDAMYLAGLIADDKRMTKADLQDWAKKAYCPGIAEYTVAWVAAHSDHGWEMGLKWIDAKSESIASTGWNTLSSYVSITPDDQLDLAQLKKLLERVEKTIAQQPNRVKYVMNNFVIAVGCMVAPLSETALRVGKNIGSVEVDMHGTACKVPDATQYIAKVKKAGKLGKKRASAKC